MPRKRPPQSNIEDAVKREIASAAEEIPKLIYQSIREQEHTSARRDTPKSAQRQYETHQDRAKKQLVWLGVGCITLIILAMWVWNMKIFWYQTQEASKEQANLWEDTKKDLDKVIEAGKPAAPTTLFEALGQEKQKAEQENNSSALRQAVTTLFSQQATSTTSTPAAHTSSTPQTIVTTTTTSTVATSSTQP